MREISFGRATFRGYRARPGLGYLAPLAFMQLRRFFRPLALSLFFFACSYSATHAAPTMSTSGSFSVTPSGAFSYSIPIKTPPGAAGMAPVLSLDYMSNGGDGMLGLGWSVSGIPSIQRCARTLAQDGVHGGVNYDTDDRFCLEGKRLVAISGTYGDSGTHYRTEVDEFSDIESFGTSGAGSGESPAYFIVHTKSGQIMYFGWAEDADNPSNNSRLTLSTTNLTVKAWGLEKLVDHRGNYEITKYTLETGPDHTTHTSGYPAEIYYTGNTGSSLSPFAKVVFLYNFARPDITPAYHAGFLQQTTKLLSNIQTFVNNAQVSNYKLTYNLASSGASHDELASVQQCDGGSVCLPIVQFGWQGSRNNPTLTSTTPPSLSPSNLVGDFNGDGLVDLIPNSVDPCAPFGFAQIYLGTAGGGFALSGMTMGSAPACFAPLFSQPTDYSGSGFSDIYGDAYNITDHIFLNDGHGHFTHKTITGPWSAPSYTADLNGDGFTDLYFSQPSASGLDYTEFGNGDGTFRTGQTITWPSPTAPVQLADYDGDGCIDQSTFDGITPTTAIYSCSPAVSQVSGPPGCNLPLIGDFNGDTLADITCSGRAYFSTGTGFIAGPLLPTNTTKPILVGDFNGDGKSDLLENTTIYLSTGNGFSPLATTITPPTENAYAADWNNDGAADFWIQGSTPTSTGIQYLFSYVPELLTSVNNGVGKVVSVQYDRLNKNTFYTKGSSAAYPTEDVDSALYVVTSVALSDGIGGTRQSTYAYTGAQADLNGLGFLGFASISRKDVQTGIIQTTSYRTDFPYTALVASQVTTAPKTGGGTVVTGSLVNNYQKINLGTGTDSVVRWFVELCSVVQSSKDEDFSTGTAYAMPTVTTAYTYDFDTGGSCSGGSTSGYGNVTGIVETVVGASTSTKTTANQYYSANTTKWLVSLLQESDVTRVVGTSTITRHTSYRYNTYGLLSAEVMEPAAATTDPLRLEADYLYDAFGNRQTVTVKACVWIANSCVLRSRSTTFAYDVPTYHGAYLTQTTNALSQSESWTYDARFGAVASHTDLNALVTSWSYNTLGQETQETRPDNTKTLFQYRYCTAVPCTGLPATISTIPAHTQYFSYEIPERTTDSSQYATVKISYYDSLDRGVGVDTEGLSSLSCDTLSTACWVRQAASYDNLGRLHNQSRPYFLAGGTAKLTTYTYDILNRTTRIDYPDLSKTTMSYRGATTSATNDKSQTTTTLRNDQGLIQAVTDAISKQTTYTYDAYGEMLSVKDPNNNTTSFTYDVRGRRLSASDPDTGSWSYVFDGYNELYSQTDAKTQTTTLTYDVLGRVLTRTEPDMTSTFTYDTGTHGIGRLTSETTGSDFTRAYAYADFAGRPSSTTITIDSTPHTYSYGYHSNQQLATIAYPSGFVLYLATPSSLGYLYDLREDNGSGQLLWQGSSRDAEDHVLFQTAGNGVGTAQTFDPNTGLPLTTKAGTSNSVANQSYQFDTLGNLTQRTWSTNNSGTALVTENACYDSLNRLIQYDVSGQCPDAGHVSVDYRDADGAIGNITRKSDVCNPGAAQCMFYGGTAGPHALTSIQGTYNGITNPTFTYDANGNMTSGAGRTITSTSFNMAATINKGAFNDALTYDSQHQRIKQVAVRAGTTTTYYINDPVSGVMEERVVAGTTVTWHDYLQAEGKLIGERFCVDPGATCTATPSYNFFTLDHLGSVAVVADSSGAVLERLSYDPWGSRRNIDGSAAACTAISSSTSRGFTSQEMMDGICTINFNARLYEPGLGRFMSADRVVQDVYRGQNLNRYSYVENRPLSAIDPSGEDIEQVVAGAERYLPGITVPADISLGGFAPLSPSLPMFGAATTLGNNSQGPASPVPQPAANARTQTSDRLDEASAASDVSALSNPANGDAYVDANGVTQAFINGQWVPVTEKVTVTGKRLPSGFNNEVLIITVGGGPTDAKDWRVFFRLQSGASGYIIQHIRSIFRYKDDRRPRIKDFYEVWEVHDSTKTKFEEQHAPQDDTFKAVGPPGTLDVTASVAFFTGRLPSSYKKGAIEDAKELISSAEPPIGMYQLSPTVERTHFHAEYP